MLGCLSQPGVSLALMPEGSFLLETGKHQISSLAVLLGNAFEEQRVVTSFSGEKTLGRKTTKTTALLDLCCHQRRPKGTGLTILLLLPLWQPLLELELANLSFCWISEQPDPLTASERYCSALHVCFRGLESLPPCLPLRHTSCQGTCGPSWLKPTCSVAMASQRSPHPPAQLREMEQRPPVMLKRRKKQ